jgi:hypothetical protein
LIEVLADFYFEADEGREWDPKRLPDFTNAIKSLGYPDESNMQRPGSSGCATKT